MSSATLSSRLNMRTQQTRCPTLVLRPKSSRPWANSIVWWAPFILLGLGLALGGLDAIGLLVVGVALFSVGESVLDPRIDSQVAEVVTRNRQGLVFGWLGVGVAVGGTFGNLVPGIAGNATHFFSAWLVIGIAGVAVALLWRSVFAPAAEFPKVDHGPRSTSSS